MVTVERSQRDSLFLYRKNVFLPGWESLAHSHLGNIKERGLLKKPLLLLSKKVHKHKTRGAKLAGKRKKGEL